MLSKVLRFSEKTRVYILIPQISIASHVPIFHCVLKTKIIIVILAIVDIKYYIECSSCYRDVLLLCVIISRQFVVIISL